MPQFVFVFDFDQTLIMSDSSGQPNLSLDYNTNDCMIQEIIQMLQSLKARNIPVYVNTQGIANQVEQYLKYRLSPFGVHFKDLIKDVFGSNNIDDILNPFPGKTLTEINKMMKQIQNKAKKHSLIVPHTISTLWTIRKTQILDKIAVQEKTAKKNVYFFDDCAMNILYAQSKGYKNSFVIFDPKYPQNHPHFGNPDFNIEDFRYCAFTLLLVYRIVQKLPLKNKGTGAGGANTNKYGKQFENNTDSSDHLIKEGFQKDILGYSKIFVDKKVIFTTQSDFKKYMNVKFGKKVFRHPDEAFIIEFNSGKIALFIVEKKRQGTEGSVETKLWAAPSLKREYEIVLGETFKVDYALCLNEFLYKRLYSLVGDKEEKQKYKCLVQILTESDIQIYNGNEQNYSKKLIEQVLKID